MIDQEIKKLEQETADIPQLVDRVEELLDEYFETPHLLKEKQNG